VNLNPHAPPPANDLCAGATPITLSSRPDGGLGAALTVTNAGATNDTVSSASGACAGNGYGGDVVYSLHLSTSQPGITARISELDGGMNEPVVSIQSAPCTLNPDGGSLANELACGDWQITDGGAVAKTGALSSGDYFIWVDSFRAGTPGQATLEVTVP
jgi:hypothetical protein